MIILREKPLGDESELKMQWQQLGPSRKMRKKLNTRNWRTESPDKCFMRWRSLSETVWAILLVPQWGRWGRWWCWNDRAGQAERRWRNRLGEGHIHQISAGNHAEVSQKQRKLDEWTQLGGWDVAVYFHEWEKIYGTSELRVPVAAKMQIDQDVATLSPTTFGELIECVDIVLGISHMKQRTSRPGGSHMRLGSGKSQSDTGKAGLVPALAPDSSPMGNAKSVEPISFHSHTEPPQLITL